jgi:hypothetical protein
MLLACSIWLVNDSYTTLRSEHFEYTFMVMFCDASIQEIIYTLAYMFIEIYTWLPQLPFKYESVPL